MTEEEIINLGSQLVALPFCMANLGHDTIRGHRVYIHNSPVFEAYLDWFACQNDDTLQGLIDATGGQEHFRQVCLSISKATGEALAIILDSGNQDEKS